MLTLLQYELNWLTYDHQPKGYKSITWELRPNNRWASKRAKCIWWFTQKVGKDVNDYLLEEGKLGYFKLSQLIEANQKKPKRLKVTWLGAEFKWCKQCGTTLGDKMNMFCSAVLQWSAFGKTEQEYRIKETKNYAPKGTVQKMGHKKGQLDAADATPDCAQWRGSKASGNRGAETTTKWQYRQTEKLANRRKPYVEAIRQDKGKQIVKREGRQQIGITNLILQNQMTFPLSVVLVLETFYNPYKKFGPWAKTSSFRCPQRTQWLNINRRRPNG